MEVVTTTLQTLRATVGCSSVVALWRVIAPMGLLKFMFKLLVQYFELPDGLPSHRCVPVAASAARARTSSCSDSLCVQPISFYIMYACSQTNNNLSK